MDNQFKWCGTCSDLTELCKWDDNNKTTSRIINPGDLIKFSSQLGPQYGDCWFIVLHHEMKCDDDDDDDEKKCRIELGVVENNVFGFLIAESNLQYRLIIHHNRNTILTLKITDFINIYLNSGTDWTLKICCAIEFIGEVPEYGKGIYFMLSAPGNFKFPANRQNNLMRKYTQVSPESVIIVTASIFFEQMEFGYVTNRAIETKPEVEELQLRFFQLKQCLLLDNSLKNIEKQKSTNLQFNMDPLICPICRKECPTKSGILLSNCGHFVCCECLTNYVNASSRETLCPFMSKTYNCHSKLKEYEIVGLSSDETKKLIETNETHINDLSSSEFTKLQCMYCFDYCSGARIFTGLQCNHNICNNCLMVYLNHQPKDKMAKVNCPVKSCEYILTSLDILEMFLRLDRFYITSELKLFEICVNCQVAHPNYATCKLFQDYMKTSTDSSMIHVKEKYGKLVGDGGALLCPKCELVIIKQGHDKEYCPNCTVYFDQECQPKPLQCGICCNKIGNGTRPCRICGKHSTNDVTETIPMVTCNFCRTDVTFANGIVLNCSHFFCKACLECLVNLNETDFKCPYEVNSKKCLAHISEFEIVQIIGEHRYMQNKTPKEQMMYQDLLKLDDVPVILNSEPFYCLCCMTNFDVGEGIMLRDCLHLVCRECLTGIIEHTQDIDVPCPFVGEENGKQFKCESFLEEREIKAIVNEKMYNQFLERRYVISKINLKHGFQCQAPDCNGFWENVGEENERECPSCKVINCFNCKAIHPNMKCDEYQTISKTKKKLEDEIDRGIGMRCPNCQIIIVRDEGCDWVQCFICKTEICWATKGPRWGPNGPGDTSGGCKCAVGQRCHQDCRGCH